MPAEACAPCLRGKGPAYEYATRRVSREAWPDMPDPLRRFLARPLGGGEGRWMRWLAASPKPKPGTVATLGLEQPWRQIAAIKPGRADIDQEEHPLPAR